MDFRETPGVCGILYERRLEEVCDNLGLTLSSAQMTPNHFHQMVSIFRWPLPYRLALEVVIEVFIRIQFRAIARQEEHLDLIAVAIHPRSD